MKRSGESGFTLIEVLISLALFSLIGGAGFAIVDSVLRVQSRTDERLERLAELQRAMHLMTLDFEQMADGILIFDGTAVAIRRTAASRQDGVLSVRYDLSDGVIRRTLSGGLGSQLTEQSVIRDVAALRWQFHAPGGGWETVWPPDAAQTALPDALKAEIELSGDTPGLSGVLHRVIRLPAEPRR